MHRIQMDERSVFDGGNAPLATFPVSNTCDARLPFTYADARRARHGTRVCASQFKWCSPGLRCALGKIGQTKGPPEWSRSKAAAEPAVRERGLAFRLDVRCARPSKVVGDQRPCASSASAFCRSRM